MKLPKFLFGLAIGALFGIIFWYWQKSTSAEDGALTVLDRLASSEARARDLESRLRMVSGKYPSGSVKTVSSSVPNQMSSDQVTDDLQEINGIGPTYARRLQEAGINTFLDLANRTPGNLMEISGARSEQMTMSWISEAQERLSG